MIKVQKALMLSLATVLASGLVAIASASNESLEKLLTDAKILDSKNKIKVTLDLPNAACSVSTYAENAASERDCKISAILLSQKVMAAVPDLSRVKVLYFESTDPSRYREATVRQGDIKAFESGQLDNKKLLSSIELTPHTMPGASDGKRQNTVSGVVEGPLAARRLRLRASIEELKEKGINVSAYNAGFSNLEDLVSKSDEQKIRSEVERLERAVNEQLGIKNENSTAKVVATASQSVAALKEGNAFYKQAQAAFVRGDYNSAIKLLNSGAIAAKPDEASYFLLLGYSYAHRAKSNDFRDAEASYKRAGELNPRLWQAWDYLGDLYFTQMRYREAKEMYGKTLTCTGVDPHEVEEIHENMKRITQQMSGSHPDD